MTGNDLMHFLSEVFIHVIQMYIFFFKIQMYGFVYHLCLYTRLQEAICITCHFADML